VVPDAVTHQRPYVLRPVGPLAVAVPTGQRSPALAADNHFAAALLTLWHRAAVGGGGVGFTASHSRSDIAPIVTDLVTGLRTGRRYGLAATIGSELVGAAFLVPRTMGTSRHVADLLPVIVERAQEDELASTLLGEMLHIAQLAGLKVVMTSAPAALGKDRWFGQFGFVPVGRIAGGVLSGPPPGGGAAVTSDEILYQFSSSSGS
jgi:predicted N-acetyltransferase YhbS